MNGGRSLRSVGSSIYKHLLLTSLGNEENKQKHTGDKHIAVTRPPRPARGDPHQPLEQETKPNQTISVVTLATRLLLQPFPLPPPTARTLPHPPTRLPS